MLVSQNLGAVFQMKIVQSCFDQRSAFLVVMVVVDGSGKDTLGRKHTNGGGKERSLLEEGLTELGKHGIAPKNANKELSVEKKKKT